MQYITGTTEFQFSSTCAVIGKFDGMHIGHRFLLCELERHRKLGLTTVIFTFDVRPDAVLAEKKIQNIYTEEEKNYLLRQTGADVLISYPFTEESANMEPEAFIRDVLCKKLGIKVLIIGKDFRFGKNREGSSHTLSAYADAYGYQVKVFDKVEVDGQAVSSTLIRKELSAGNLAFANQLLGRPFLIRGAVEHGRKLGRKLGMPTMNLRPAADKLLPPNGVYFSVTDLEWGRFYGITNIGIKPTVANNGEINVETHLFHFQDDVYGQTAVVELHQFHRPEIKFTSEIELQQQIMKDMRIAETYFIHSF